MPSLRAATIFAIRPSVINHQHYVNEVSGVLIVRLRNRGDNKAGVSREVFPCDGCEGSRVLQQIKGSWPLVF